MEEKEVIKIKQWRNKNKTKTIGEKRDICIKKRKMERKRKIYKTDKGKRK
jgi:hypothetical protein